MRRSDVVVTPGESMTAYLRAWRGCPSDVQITAVPHAVDLSRFSYEPRTPVTSGRLSLLVVSHPAPHKALDTAIRATADLARQGLDVSLTMTIDRHGYQGRFQRYVDGLVVLANQLGINERVVLAGRSERVEDLYHACDVVLFPSLTESFGFPTVEAMACGTPIVASAIPSSIEVLGDVGRFFDVGDHHAAADQVRGWLDADTATRQRLVEQGRQRAEGFTWRSNAAAVAELVERCTVA
jgi:glycosyltransferase involved in cell wall biosynthesis